MFRKLIGACVGLAMMGIAGTASAVVIYEQPITAGESSSLVSNGVTFQANDSFVLDLDATLTDVHWFGSSSSLDFTIILYLSSGTIPDLASLFYTVDVTAESLNIVGESFDAFWVDPILSVDLLGGVEYWISIVGSDFSWSRPSSTPGISQSLRLSDGQFLGQASNPAFSLTATEVPEPSTLALFATGLALLAFFGWRRRGVVQVKAA